MAHWEEILGQTQDTPKYISQLAQEQFRVPGGGGWGERGLGVRAQIAAPTTWTQIVGRSGWVRSLQ